MLGKDLNIVIIGAGGAIGNEFTLQLAEDQRVKSIYAFSSKVNVFANNKINSNLLDIIDEQQIKLAAARASENASINMVIVATGMLHNNEFMPEKSLKELDKDKFQQLFAINTIAPAMIAKYFLPKLSKENTAIFAALSARVGSINDNHLGGWYAYRASKAALNMIIKNCAIELKRINKNALIVGLHPGTVASALSEPFQKSVATEKLFSAQYSVTNLLKVLEDLNISDSGLIIDYKGDKIEY